MSEERVHRPPLERKEPHRDFANLFSSARASAEEGDPAAWDGARAGGPSDAAGDFVTEGVGVAYKVIEAYLRQGQRVAQEFGRLAYAPLSMSDQLPDLQARWMQLWTDAMANWFEMLGLFTESMAPRATPPPVREPPPPPSPPEPAPAPAAGVGFAYEVASPPARPPARVHAEFHPGRETFDLACHGLRSLEPGRPPIGVGFGALPDQRRVVIRIEVPDGQEPGVYTGALLDARDGSAAGSLTLRLR